MTQFAKDVAKHMDRRQQRRRLVRLVVVLAAVIAAALYLRCGRGWGTGGEGPGPGGSVANAARDAGPKRCAIRVTAQGITVDGKPATSDQAVAACKKTAGATVIVTGDAPEGSWTSLKAALDDAGITIDKRE